MTVATVVGLAAGRLSPVAPGPDKYPDETAVLAVCRATVREVQPFTMAVFVLSADVPDRFMRLLHDAVGAAVRLTVVTAAGQAIDEERRVDSQVGGAGRETRA